MSSRSLTVLPNELLYLVANFLDREEPPALAALSQTCRRTYAACHDLVTARRDLDKQYRVIHDRYPLNIPNLLKLASDDALREAWHVRRAEFWGHRSYKVHWCEMSDFVCSSWPAGSRNPIWLLNEYDPGNDPWQTNKETGQRWFNEILDQNLKKTRALQAQGLERLRRDEPIYRMMLEKMYNFTDEGLVEALLEEALDGDEELIKALLLPLCKNIDTIIFLQHPQDTIHYGGHWLRVFNYLIEQCHLNRTDGWFPGFLSLRKISINSETSAREELVFVRRGDSRMIPVEVTDIEPLFTLPNLKILRLTGLQATETDRLSDSEDDEYWSRRRSIGPGTSSIEVLEIAKSDLDMTDAHRLLSLPRRLRVFRSDDPYTPMYLRGLHNCPDSVPKSLERLDFRSIKGERLWVLANYPSLRHVDGITADCLVWRSSKSVPAPTGPQESFEFPIREEVEDPIRGECCETDATSRMVTLEALELTLPPNIETLRIHFLVVEVKGWGFFNAFIRELLRNVSGRAEDDAHTGADFPHLRGVTFLLQNGTLPEDFEWDEEALANLEAKGIHISHEYISSTPEPPEFEDVDELDWEHCFEDRHYTDPRHDVEGYEGKRFGMVRSFQDPARRFDY